jgi:hypothetical protein
MQNFFKRAVLVAVLGLASAANATVITFDALDDSPGAPWLPFMTHEDFITESGFWVGSYSTKAGAIAGEDFVGALVDGKDIASSCFGVVCANNNQTQFLVALNDGFLDIGRTNSSTFTLGKFDASFIAASGDAVLSPAMLLRVDGYLGSVKVVSEDFYLSGPVSGGYSFSTFSLNDIFANTAITELGIYGYACTTTTSCTRNLDKAQFAIDNISTITAVPEPASWLMTGLGLAMVGAIARRRRVAPDSAA